MPADSLTKETARAAHNDNCRYFVCFARRQDCVAVEHDGWVIGIVGTCGPTQERTCDCRSGSTFGDSLSDRRALESTDR
jgi:hypothetical protein